MDNLTKFTKKELINIIRAARAELKNSVEEAEEMGARYNDDGRKNYAYSFGYLSSNVRNVYNKLDI